ncbi:hypothetical protein ACJH6J_19750 [Mycobacterium sp. SMC-18]|uniref:hypothetical protein n=1 Tax=Mycobacterium sp. SMC-18 TaxID=3381629 RepID=UPI00387695B7
MAPIERYQGGKYGEATVVPPAFPDVDENALNDIGVRLMALGDRLDGELIPHHAHQRMQLSDWEGEAGRLAQAAATGVLGSYGDACKAAYDAARKVFRAESAVVQTKNEVNRTAELIQQACLNFEQASTNMLAAAHAANESRNYAAAEAFFNAAALFTKMIETMKTVGLAENTAAVAKCATGLAQELGVPAGTPGADGKMPPPVPPPSPNVPGSPGNPPPAGAPAVGGGQGGAGGTATTPLGQPNEGPKGLFMIEGVERSAAVGL